MDVAVVVAVVADVVLVVLKAGPFLAFLCNWSIKFLNYELIVCLL